MVRDPGPAEAEAVVNRDPEDLLTAIAAPVRVPEAVKDAVRAVEAENAGAVVNVLI